MTPSAILVDPKDNVATALRQLEPGDTLQVGTGDNTADITLLQAVPFGHKFALKDIGPGGPVIKYGEIIGLATEKIRNGEHVHVHNVEGLRGRGDKR